MNRTRIPYFVCFLSGLIASTLQGQSLITFEEFPFPSAFLPGTSLSSEGFVIQNLGSINAEITPCTPPCPDNGTQYLLTQVDGLLRLTHSTGRAFSLESFDAAESFSGLSGFWAGQIVVTGDVLGGGTVQASFSLDLINDGPGPLNDFQKFALPPTFADLTALTITGSGNAGRNDFSLDNLRLTVVPEPSTGVLLGLGGLGLLYSLWKRRNAAS